MNVFVFREIKDSFETVKDLEKIGVKSKSLPTVSYTHLRAHETRHDLV